MKKVLVLLFVVSLSFGLATTSMAAVFNFGGHQYELVYVAGGLDWNAAHTAATSVAGWNLAVITSQAEQDFIVNTVIGSIDWTATGVNDHLWIGGFQSAGGNEPGVGWQWVTGEPFALIGPSSQLNDVVGDAFEEDYLQVWSDKNWLWDDVTVADGSAQQRGYIRETVPEPSTLLLLGSGLLGLVGYGRKRMKK